MRGIWCVFLVLVGAQGSIILTGSNYLIYMRSATMHLRMLENKDKYFTAMFTEATTSQTSPSNIDIKFGKANSSSPELEVTSFSLKLQFDQSGDYWEVSQVNASLNANETGKAVVFSDNELISSIGLYAPKGLSFHCSRFGPLSPAFPPANHTFTVDLDGFQMQISNQTDKFHEAYECVGFFSIGILSGIFITIILMAVLAWGLAMIMDVKTMDRFDDPKGKPVSFGGTE